MNCRACGGTSLERVFAMDPMPLAGAFADTEAEAVAAPRYALEWLWCAGCGLVNVAPDIPDETLYRHYAYAASTVPALVRHHAEFATFLRERHGESARLLEVGCNDGVLLRQLDGWVRVGVDPSDVARERRTYDYDLVNLPFGLEVAEVLGRFDVVTSSNSFAHFTAIESAIAGVAQVLAPDGTAYIEVHDLHATLDSGQWDTIYHEHKVEWSLGSLRRAFARHGLVLVEWWERPLHGGLLRAAFQHGRPKRLVRPMRPSATMLRHRYETRHDGPKADAAYGAAGRATVYLNQTDTGARYVVDGSPTRAGKYVPGVGLPIVTPEEFDRDGPARTLITAWNHADDIRRRHPDYAGRWVTAW